MSIRRTCSPGSLAAQSVAEGSPHTRVSIRGHDRTRSTDRRGTRAANQSGVPRGNRTSVEAETVRTNASGASVGAHSPALLGVTGGGSGWLGCRWLDHRLAPAANAGYDPITPNHRSASRTRPTIRGADRRTLGPPLNLPNAHDVTCRRDAHLHFNPRGWPDAVGPPRGLERPQRQDCRFEEGVGLDLRNVADASWVDQRLRKVPRMAQILLGYVVDEPKKKKKGL